MRTRELEVEGAVAFTPEVFGDDRGLFVSMFFEPAFVGALGHKLFGVAQASSSRSRRGVVRGVHFTATPPGNAKYVWCLHGRVLDIVVDLRVGSPTFGRWDSAELSPDDFTSLYLPLGLGHAFVALEDDTVISYLLSASYVPENELAVSVIDPELGLPLPRDLDLVMSERDRDAMTLDQARAAGVLPEYALCQKLEGELVKPHLATEL